MSMIEIANKAGVSQATVSRFFNGSSRVDSAKAKAINNAAAAIGYVHNTRKERNAEKLPLDIIENTALVFWGQGKTISTRPGITLLIQGIESALSKHGGRLLIAEVNSAEALAARVENGGYTSLILSGDSPDKEVIKILDRFPSVWLLSRLPDLDIKIDQIMPDDTAIGQLAADYLLKNSRKRRFAFINSERNHYSFNMRCKAFCDKLLESGSKCDILLGEITWANPNESQFVADIRKLVDRLLSMDTLPDGIFLPSDDQTSVFYAELNQRNFNIAENFNIISCNHIMPFLYGLRPRPVSIDISLNQIGQLAVYQLLWRSFMGFEMPSVVTLVEPKLIDNQ